MGVSIYKKKKEINNYESQNFGLNGNVQLNIYVCGNKKELNNFYEKEVLEDREDNHKILLKNYEIYHKNNEWCFTFYNNDMTKDLVNELMNDIKNNIKDNNNNNNLVLIFFYSTKNNLEKNTNLFITIMECFELMTNVYKPILVFAIKKTKKDEDNEEDEDEDEEFDNEKKMELFIDENSLKKNYKNYLNKYIQFVCYENNNYNEIIKTINSIFCYYNNISDYFSLLDEIILHGDESYHIKRKNKIKYHATFNILVIGRPGSGKSTLINLLLNKRKAKEGIGFSVTKIVSKYIHDKYPISFQDTPGFENNKDLEKMKNFLYNTNYIFKEGKSNFHLILFVINASNERSFIGEEIDLINYIKETMNIPIFFVCTMSKSEEYAKDFEEVLKLNLWQNFGEDTNLVNNIYSCHLLNEKDGVYKRFGIDNLLKNIQDYYMKEINQREENLIDKKIISNPNKNIFLGDVKEKENFKDYLIRISNNIISKYENFTYRQIYRVKKEKKTIELNNDKINEMLVDHLALELNGERCGKDFCQENKKKIENDVDNNIENNETSQIRNKYKIIKDKNEIKSIIITKTIGQKAANHFLKKIDNEGLNYLKDIIKDYKTAIESLPKLYEDLNKNPAM